MNRAVRRQMIAAAAHRMDRRAGLPPRLSARETAIIRERAMGGEDEHLIAHEFGVSVGRVRRITRTETARRKVFGTAAGVFEQEAAELRKRFGEIGGGEDL